VVRVYPYLIRPILFRFDPERMHDAAIAAGRFFGRCRAARAVLSSMYGFSDPRLETDVCGLRFPNPVGLAAGFDKNGRAVRALAALGFGHVEIGSVSADPSPGNPRPRLWRLPRDRAIVVWYGLPNDGADAVARALGQVDLPVPLGINIVKTHHGVDAPPEPEEAVIADYVDAVRKLKDVGDYLHLNLSCPNTETGRDFFAERAHVVRLLTALRDLDLRCPVFLKISPLGGPAAIEAWLESVEGFDFVSGFAFNLAPGMPEGLRTPSHKLASMRGATSGKPIERQMNEMIRQLYRRMDRKRYRIIGIGGVFTAEDAYEKIRLGASLVQLLTGMIYEGPGIVRCINEGLCRLLERDGFAFVSEAVGTAHGPISSER